MDIHAGDASEDLQPYAGFYTCGKQFPAARKMADALGFPWVIGSDNVPMPGNTKYCSAEAVLRDIPTVAIEYGKLGHVTPEEAEFISARLINMMRATGWYDGVPETYSAPVEILSPIDGFIIYMTVTSPVTKGETIFSLE